VRNYVDDGKTQGSGGPQVRWIRKQAQALGINLREIDNDEITALPNKEGLTDAAIDDIKCPLCDPKIVVLSGGQSKNPGWSETDFGNWNNHSLVIRVDFGKSSFLFTGDLEVPGIEKLAGYYSDTKMLRADVYQVGHHGSWNGTTRELVEAISPSIAVIGVGRWDYGLNSSYPFTTYRYGHPRREVIDLLSEWIPGNRNNPISIKVFEGSQDPIDYTVKKSIYATGWDGDVRVSAKLDGTFQVSTGTPNGKNAAHLRLLGRLNPYKRAPEEGNAPYDSVIPDWPVSDFSSSNNERCFVERTPQRCRQPRLFLFRRR
jgi:hypothetical protein